MMLPLFFCIKNIHECYIEEQLYMMGSMAFKQTYHFLVYCRWDPYLLEEKVRPPYGKMQSYISMRKIFSYMGGKKVEDILYFRQEVQTIFFQKGGEVFSYFLRLRRYDFLLWEREESLHFFDNKNISLSSLGRRVNSLL